MAQFVPTIGSAREITTRRKSAVCGIMRPLNGATDAGQRAESISESRCESCRVGVGWYKEAARPQPQSARTETCAGMLSDWRLASVRVCAGGD